MLYKKFAELKYKYGNREFRRRECYVDTLGKSETRIVEYIRKQQKEEKIGEQMTVGSTLVYGRQVAILAYYMFTRYERSEGFARI